MRYCQGFLGVLCAFVCVLCVRLYITREIAIDLYSCEGGGMGLAISFA